MYTVHLVPSFFSAMRSFVFLGSQCPVGKYNIKETLRESSSVINLVLGLAGILIPKYKGGNEAVGIDDFMFIVELNSYKMKGYGNYGYY